METYTKFIKSTPFDSLAVIWSMIDNHPKVIRILISNPDISAIDQYHKFYSNSQESSHKEINTLSRMIKSFLKGENVSFSLDILALEKVPLFQKLVLMTDYKIPRGNVSTYKLIAQYLGKNKAYRAVANALARNPFPLIVPCHRVIRSNGHLGDFQGGEYMKRSLLKMEGVKFDNQNRIIVDKLYFS